MVKSTDGLQGSCVFYPHPPPQIEQRTEGPGEDHTSRQGQQAVLVGTNSQATLPQIKPLHPHLCSLKSPEETNCIHSFLHVNITSL